MRMVKFAKIFFLVMATVIFIDIKSCTAESLKFIDSEGDTGYFVDTDSFAEENNSVFRVNMVVIRINLNEMDAVNLRINHRLQTYIIRSIKTYSYDKRTEIKSDDQIRPTRNYQEKSLMGDLVKLVLEGELD